MKANEKYIKNPLHGTDFSKPISEIIENVRNELTKTRGTLQDIIYAYPESETIRSLNTGIEGITLVVSYLYDEVKQHQKIEKKK